MPLRRRNNRGPGHRDHLPKLPDQHGPAIPIGQLIGHTYADALDVDIVSIRCPRCDLTIDANEWPEHWDKECPALEPAL